MGIGLADRAGRAIGQQLACPTGTAGRAIGQLMRVANRRPTRALLASMDIRATDRVLDVGCGDGTLLRQIGSCGWRCGIDRSPTMVAAARRQLRGLIRDGRADVREGDMVRLPFGTGAFDRIIASNVLYFCADVPAFVLECRRVARRGALLGIYVTDSSSMATWRFAQEATHRHFDAASLRRDLRAAGIADQAIEIQPLHLPGSVLGLIVTARIQPI